MIFSIEAVKALDKIQHPFLIKTLGVLGIEDGCLSWINGICNTSTANIIVDQEYFPSTVGNKARLSALITSIYHHTGKLSQGNKAIKTVSGCFYVCEK